MYLKICQVGDWLDVIDINKNGEAGIVSAFQACPIDN